MLQSLFTDYEKTMAQGIDILGVNWEVQRIYHKEGIILGRYGKGNESSKGFALIRATTEDLPKKTVQEIQQELMVEGSEKAQKEDHYKGHWVAAFTTFVYPNVTAKVARRLRDFVKEKLRPLVKNN